MRAVVLVGAVLMGLSSPSWAQDAAPAADATSIDATKLGVSLSRIQKALQVAEPKPKESGTGLRLEFNIQVFGTAPKIEVLKGVDLVGGHVPGSAPTHQQFREFITPQMYRLPGLPISAFAAWATQWVWQQSKKSRCEEEIANYRAMVMQGVNVSAPRCTQ